MAEYYVVRDKNTGLYFRGKGVNRWGKYYNQASIYRIRANAENTIKEVAWRGEQAEVVPIRIIENTADVAEVVRCKDCTEWNEKEGECSHWYGFRENDFCCFGIKALKERCEENG
jgi:hypothetical protein